MKPTIINIMLIFSVTAFSFYSVNAQQSINVTGNDISGGGGSVSYSVGQVADHTYTGTTGSVVEGVQQPYEISVVTEIKEANGINLSVLAYPNPAENHLILKVQYIEHASLQFQLYDVNGKRLQSGKIAGHETEIVMDNLLPATYFVKVIQDNKELKILKIIKN